MSETFGDAFKVTSDVCGKYQPAQGSAASSGGSSSGGIFGGKTQTDSTVTPPGPGIIEGLVNDFPKVSLILAAILEIMVYSLIGPADLGGGIINFILLVVFSLPLSMLYFRLLTASDKGFGFAALFAALGFLLAVGGALAGGLSSIMAILHVLVFALVVFFVIKHLRAS